MLKFGIQRLSRLVQKIFLERQSKFQSRYDYFYQLELLINTQKAKEDFEDFLSDSFNLKLEQLRSKIVLYFVLLYNYFSNLSFH